MKLRPMLAATLKTGQLPKLPCFASPKLDGIRALVLGGKVYSRSLKLIPSPDVQRLFGKPEYEGFDGELIFGDPRAEDCFTVTDSFVTTGRHSRDASKLTFFVFDKISPLPYKERYKELQDIIERSANRQMVALHQTVVTTGEQFDALEESWTQAGYEGIMARSPLSSYKFGRSTVNEGYLFKRKPYTDAEALVLEVLERQINDNPAFTNEVGRTARSKAKAGLRPGGTMGALRVRDLETEVDFDCHPGKMDDAEKAKWWAQREAIREAGLVITYRYLKKGTKTKPRHPQYVRIKNPLELA
jgi:DNA ligase-1